MEQKHPDTVIAEVHTRDGQVASTLKVSDAPRREVEKFLEEVRNGAYPLTALRPTYRAPVVSRHGTSPDVTESPEAFDEETRRIMSIEFDLESCPENVSFSFPTFTLKMDDHMNRQIRCDHHPGLSPVELVEELIHFGLIHVVSFCFFTFCTFCTLFTLLMSLR